MGPFIKNEEIQLNSMKHNNHFSSNVPPWCSTGKASERNKARKISPQLRQERSHFLLKNEREVLQKDKSVQNSSCFGKRKNCRYTDNTEKYWIYKVLVALFVLVSVILQGFNSKSNGKPKCDIYHCVRSVFNETSINTFDGECCYKMKRVMSQLTKAEQRLRLLRRKQTFMLNLPNNIPAKIYNKEYGNIILNAIASKGENTEEWGGRAALWGIVPLWRASPPPQTVLLARSPAVADCWPFRGSSGQLNIELPSYTSIQAVSVEHIYPDAARSAPDRFRLYGILENGTWVETIAGRYSKQGPAKQLYPTNIMLPRLKKAVFKVYSNHGNPKYTCVYRVHIYGNSYEHFI